MSDGPNVPGTAGPGPSGPANRGVELVKCDRKRSWANLKDLDPVALACISKQTHFQGDTLTPSSCMQRFAPETRCGMQAAMYSQHIQELWEENSGT